jgi:hypothetical protein
MENPAPTNEDFHQRPGTPQYWLQFFGQAADAAAHCDYPLRGSATENAAVQRDPADRVLLFRFDDDVTETCAERGHRILFSALEEDEHPDLVGTDGE